MKNITILFFLLALTNIYSQLPTSIFPLNNVKVTNPVSFSWIPSNGNNNIDLMISSNATMSTVDILNFHDDGTNYYTNETLFDTYINQTLYYKLCSQGNCTPIRSFIVGEKSIDPYYNIYCMPWPANQYWQPTDTISMTLSSLNLIKNGVGGVGSSPDRKLGFSSVVPFFYTSTAQCINIIKRGIHLSEQTNMPVVFRLDGVQWLQGRPDLWNWYEPSVAGFDLSNKKNVESFDWNGLDPVANAYRNWGVPFMLDFPHPNFSSPIILNESKNSIYQIMAVLKNWYNSLPANKKYLFAGVNVSWELQTGTNHYYPFPNGNINDPTVAKQVGYNSVQTLGLATSGAITRIQLNSVLQNYLATLSKAVLQSGIPRSKIFTHTGGHDDIPTNIVIAGAESSFNNYANPGYSFYTGGNGTSGLGGLSSSFINKSWNTWWANSEWGGGPLSTMIDFENFYNNKMINSFFDATSLYSQIINKPPRSNNRYNWSHPPVINHSVNSNVATLNWSIPSQTYNTQLLISTIGNTDEQGILSQVTTLNISPNNVSTYTVNNLPSGKYYYQLICDSYSRRVLSDVKYFLINTIDVCANDVQAPLFQSFPNNITINSTVPIAVNWIEPSATDNCSDPAITSNFYSGHTFPLGNTIVTYTARDANNNISSQSFNIYVGNGCVIAKIMQPHAVVANFTYYGLAGTSDYLFAIEHQPLGGNTNNFTAQIILTENCDINNNVYNVVDTVNKEGLFIAGYYWNIKLTSGTTNGFVNMRFFPNAILSGALDTTSNSFFTTVGSDYQSSSLYFKTNNLLNLPNDIRTDAKGLNYGFTPLLVNSTGTFATKNYVQFNQVNNLNNSGGGLLKKVTKLTQVNFSPIEVFLKGSLRYNTTNNKFEGFNGIEWTPLN